MVEVVQADASFFKLCVSFSDLSASHSRTQIKRTKQSKEIVQDCAEDPLEANKSHFFHFSHIAVGLFKLAG